MRRISNLRGFTLIELSIVLVIIGLIVGGVLVGRNLIDAAAVRAQISQIEKYQSAVNTFRTKYGGLPGDLPNPAAGQYGFAARGDHPGEGDGSGVIEGVDCDEEPGCVYAFEESTGEMAVFWNDLSVANLVDGSFTAASETVTPGGTVMGAAIGQYMPAARIGGGNSVYVWSGGPAQMGPFNNTGDDGLNYFGVSVVTSMTQFGYFNGSTPGMTVSQAYNIDKKIDDGLPQFGRVIAAYNTGGTTPGLYFGIVWAIGGSPSGPSGLKGFPVTPEDGIDTSPSPSTCYDNGGAAAIEQYSVGVNDGQGLNCALSFRFQ